MLNIIITMAVILFFIKHLSSNYNEETNEILSIQNTKSIKGFLSIVIVLHHLALFSNLGFSFTIFMPLGPVAVGCFFFISGYGLMKKFNKNANYLKSFLPNRLIKLIVPYTIANVIYFVIYNISGKKVTILGLLSSLINGNPLVQYSWYVLASIVFYIFFYVGFSICRQSNRKALALISVLLFAYCYVCRSLSFGMYWYNSCFSFLAGIAFVSKEKKAMKYYSNNRHKIKALLTITLTLSLTTFGARILLSSHSISSIIENDSIRSIALGNPVNIILLQLAIVCATLLCFLFLGTRLKANKVCNFFGDISYEVYLYHGLLMYVFRNDNFNINNSLLYFLLVAISVPVVSCSLNYLTLKSNCLSKKIKSSRFFRNKSILQYIESNLTFR